MYFPLFLYSVLTLSHVPSCSVITQPGARRQSEDVVSKFVLFIHWSRQTYVLNVA